MKVNGVPTRTIKSIDSGRAVEIIDQTLLPYRFEKVVLSNYKECISAITDMKVRGAPLIGITGAWAMVLAIAENPEDDFLQNASREITAARPTAVNLKWGVQKIYSKVLPMAPKDRFAEAVAAAEALTTADVLMNREIGRFGLPIIQKLYRELRRPVNILTHCNAGWLATVDYGTALSPIYFAHAEGIPVHVWVDETRPRNQGLLTAWELKHQGVAHTVVADNAGGHLMQMRDVDCVIVGADRITRTGDAANKIGTYLKALAAKDRGIPFYVAAPFSTIDWEIGEGVHAIEIEHRSGSELRVVHGLSDEGYPAKVNILPADEPVSNPAFDVTPARLIDGIITEYGVIKPEDLLAKQQELRNAGVVC